MTHELEDSFSAVKERLDEIVEAVSDENISLDEALGLYEEAVKLGMQVSSKLEEDIAEESVAEEAQELLQAEGVEAKGDTAAPETSLEEAQTEEATHE